MGRLKMLQPRVVVLGGRQNGKATAWAHAQGRESRQARGYGAEWDRLRKRVLERDCGLCQPCKRRGFITEAIAVDHITSKAEARLLGWTNEQIENERNLQSICRDCHDQKTKAESARARGG